MEDNPFFNTNFISVSIQSSIQDALNELLQEYQDDFDQAAFIITGELGERFVIRAADLAREAFRPEDSIGSLLESWSFPGLHSALEFDSDDLFGVDHARDELNRSGKPALVILENQLPVAYLLQTEEMGIPAMVSDDDRAEETPRMVDSDSTSTPVVNLGFAPREAPDEEIMRYTPLVEGDKYYFWLNIGAQKDTAISESSPPFDVIDELPPKAIIDVVLFSYEGEIIISPEADFGSLELQGDGKMIVRQQVEAPQGLIHMDRLEDHLFFPVQMPEKVSRSRVRCNLYYKKVLLQSHLVEVHVVAADDLPSALADHEICMWQTLDYKLSNTLNTTRIDQIEEHSLSMLLNDDGDGTHSIRVFGGVGNKWEVSITEGDLETIINTARCGLRKVSWGNIEMWDEDTNKAPYHYAADISIGEETLLEDFVTLARSGARLCNFLAKVVEKSQPDNADGDHRLEIEKIKESFRKASRVQVAAIENVNHIYPTAMVYDLPFDSSLIGDELYSLCDEFLTAFKNNTPLEQTLCFADECPHSENDRVICPSGFWGYRLILGQPVSLGDQFAENDMVIKYVDYPEISLFVYKDFELLTEHIEKVKQLRPGLVWNYGDEGGQIRQLLPKNTHIIYFYCHGGINQLNMPYLRVGGTTDAQGALIPDLFLDGFAPWNRPKPLVFINGCHTAALGPGTAMNIVENMVRYSGAVGVIGTEITIFESLATAFAEECLRLFMDGTEIGEAIRQARLKILQSGNPLGLVYIPYVLSSLKLQKED